VLTRAGLWSFQLPRFARCLGRIGLRLDYVWTTTYAAILRPRRGSVAAAR